MGPIYTNLTTLTHNLNLNPKKFFVTCNAIVVGNTDVTRTCPTTIQLRWAHSHGAILPEPIGHSSSMRCHWGFISLDINFIRYRYFPS